MFKFYGWNEDQWALAIASEKHLKDTPEKLKDFVNIKRSYLLRHSGSPIVKSVIYNPEGDTRSRDWESVNKLIELVGLIGAGYNHLKL